MTSSRLLDSEALPANQRGTLTERQRQAFVRTSTHGIGAWIGLPLAFVLLAPIAIRFGDSVDQLQGAAQVLPFALVIGMILVCVIIGNRLVAIPARLYVHRAQVERKPGHVTFENEQYRLMAGNQQLRSIYGKGMDLLPGSYTFYSLKGTRWLVAAEKEADEVSGSLAEPDRAAETLSPEPMAQHYDLQELRKALASTLGFDQVALDANRQGKLTAQQAKWLKRSGGSNFRGGIILILLAIAIIGVSLATHIDITLGEVIAVLVLLGGTGVYLLFKARSESADIQRQRVEMSEGIARKSAERPDGDNQYHYYYFINGVRFEVSKAAYEALIEQVRYRVYYAPDSKQIMSMEPVTERGSD